MYIGKHMHMSTCTLGNLKAQLLYCGELVPPVMEVQEGIGPCDRTLVSIIEQLHLVLAMCHTLSIATLRSMTLVKHRED